MSESKRRARGWWGDYELKLGESGRFRIGPLNLHLSRLPFEWQVAWKNDGELRDETVEVAVPTDEPQPPGAAVNRYTMQTTPSRVTLTPMLADRPVVIKPETPLYVPSGECVTLFVGSPVWVAVGVGDPLVPLVEVEAYRSTDTWAGPNTRVGVLCYGSRTLARLRLEDCTVRPHRAITAMEVRNEGPEALLVEQVQLPAPLLSLYVADDDVLWTQSITLIHEARSDRVKLELGVGRHPGGGVLKRIAGPRQQQDGNIIFQAFSRLFG